MGCASLTIFPSCVKRRQYQHPDYSNQRSTTWLRLGCHGSSITSISTHFQKQKARGSSASLRCAELMMCHRPGSVTPTEVRFRKAPAYSEPTTEPTEGGPGAKALGFLGAPAARVSISRFEKSHSPVSFCKCGGPVPRVRNPDVVNQGFEFFHIPRNHRAPSH